MPILRELAKCNEIIPVCSKAFSGIDTRFGNAGDHINEIEGICKRSMIVDLKEAETIGPLLKPDIMIIAPTTGNTLAKLASGIYDTPVTLGAKAHLRNCRPLVIAFASNDGLSGNFKNIADMYTRKNIFFLPMFQDDPIKKPYSLVADFSLIPKSISEALGSRQILPLFKTTQY